jgi:hypothetical protein
MALECNNGLMDPSMKEDGRMICKKVMVFSIMNKRRSKWGYGRLVNW